MGSRWIIRTLRNVTGAVWVASGGGGAGRNASRSGRCGERAPNSVRSARFANGSHSETRPVINVSLATCV
jgi:hypothetical protein